MVRVTKVGFRRVFAAAGCTVEGPGPDGLELPADGFGISIPFGGYENQIRIGLSPSMAIPIELDRGPVIYTDETKIGFSFHLKSDDTPYKGRTLVDIVCFKSVDLPQDAGQALIDIGSPDLLEMKSLCDLLVCIVGLKLHWQFVYDLVSEHPFLELDTGAIAMGPVSRIEVLARISMTFQDVVAQMPTKMKPLEHAFVSSPALFWMVKAWSERDEVLQFLALFIPVEILISKYRALPPESEDLSQRVLAIVGQHGGDEAPKLTAYLKPVLRASLNQRFRKMAATAAFPSLETDCAAFARFNRMRNDLVHKGDKVMQLQATLTNGELVHFRDVVHKYVSWALFDAKKADLSG
jgi:hypothetical protein